jgi:hypothetical protein
MEVNLNQPAGNKSVVRDLIEGWGIIRNARVGTDGAYGDLHYLTTHPATPWLLERIERDMSIGLSHNARGTARVVGGREIVESVPFVFSIDLVSRPAATKNLFESEESQAGSEESLIEVVQSALQQRKESESKKMVVTRKLLPGTSRRLLRQKTGERALVEMAIDRGGHPTSDEGKDKSGDKPDDDKSKSPQSVLDRVWELLGSSASDTATIAKLRELMLANGYGKPQHNPEPTGITESVAFTPGGTLVKTNGVKPTQRTARRVPRLISQRG